jgi:thymidine phosphorylase
VEAALLIQSLPNTHRFRQHAEIDVRVVDGRADMGAIDAALIALRDALDLTPVVPPR